MAKKQRFTAEDFVEIWQTSATLDEVTARTGLETASQRAHSLRKLGVPLKKMPCGNHGNGGKNKLNVGKLIDIARSLAGSQP